MSRCSKCVVHSMYIVLCVYWYPFRCERNLYMYFSFPKLYCYIVEEWYVSSLHFNNIFSFFTLFQNTATILHFISNQGFSGSLSESDDPYVYLYSGKLIISMNGQSISIYKAIILSFEGYLISTSDDRRKKHLFHNQNKTEINIPNSLCDVTSQIMCYKRPTDMESWENHKQDHRHFALSVKVNENSWFTITLEPLIFMQWILFPSLAQYSTWKVFFLIKLHECISFSHNITLRQWTRVQPLQHDQHCKRWFCIHYVRY